MPPALVRCALAWLAFASLALAPAVDAKTFKPNNGRSYFGVSDTGEAGDYFEFKDQVNAHPAVLETFHTWGFDPARAMGRWAETNTRGVLSISTTDSFRGTEVISPKQIAKGRGDAYPLQLNRSFSEADETVYIRLLPEMNGNWNPYSAFNSDGSSRGGGHSTRWFRQAWRRFTLIVRGGRRSKINHRLHRLGLPKIKRAKGAHDYDDLNVPGELPKAKVALLWVPQSEGSPNLASNGPGDYWPGGEYVDWVGADTYAKFPNFDGLSQIYRSFRHKPFVISEWSPWDTGDPGWVRQLFAWARHHERTRMLIYYQGWSDGDPHRISNYAGARHVVRHELNKGRFDPYAPHSRRPQPPGTPPG